MKKGVIEMKEIMSENNEKRNISEENEENNDTYAAADNAHSAVTTRCARRAYFRLATLASRLCAHLAHDAYWRLRSPLAARVQQTCLYALATRRI